MRTLILLSLLLVPSLVWADFDDGMSAYENADYHTAFSEFLLEAQSGLPTAQHNIGAMYFHGEGVDKDLIHAYAWMKLASQRGDSDSDDALEIIMFTMKSGQLQKADMLARKLSLRYHLPLNSRR